MISTILVHFRTIMKIYLISNKVSVVYMTDTIDLVMMAVELDFSWPVFKSYAFYTSILLFKLISLSFLRASVQFRKRIVPEKEDCKFFKKFRRITFDEDLMRIQRAQDDDLKNIVPFAILGLIYCFAHPSPQFARLVFQIFTGARFLHTVVYVVYIIKQPVRALAWSVGTLINMYMCFKIFFYFMV